MGSRITFLLFSSKRFTLGRTRKYHWKGKKIKEERYLPPYPGLKARGSTLNFGQDEALDLLIDLLLNGDWTGTDEDTWSGNCYLMELSLLPTVRKQYHGGSVCNSGDRPKLV